MSRVFINGLLVVAAMLVSVTNVSAEITEDPLRPPGYRHAGASTPTKRSAPSWHVDAILISDSRRVAVVNSISVKKGEHINGARVVAIEPGYITLEYNNKLITARLEMLPVKRRVTARAE